MLLEYVWKQHATTVPWFEGIEEFHASMMSIWPVDDDDDYYDEGDIDPG